MQDASSGNWLLYDGDCPFCSAYVSYVRLRETAGVDLTATYIYVQALLRANILATYGSGTWLPVSANASNDAELIFAADTHIEELSALTLES